MMENIIITYKGYETDNAKQLEGQEILQLEL